MEIKLNGVYGIDHAINGVRNPMSSNNKSDSYYNNGKFIIGDRDMKLCKRLIRAGSSHRKFLRQIFISMDIKAPRYWWTEFDTYKVGVSRNSQSTMHTILNGMLTLNDFERGFYEASYEDFMIWNLVIEYINKNICAGDDELPIDRLYKIKSILPEGFLQSATVTMDYENLLNIYTQRRNHALYEWKYFCSQIMYADYFEDFMDAVNID